MNLVRLSAVTAVLAAAPSLAHADWTQFQGNAGHTGRASGTYDARSFGEIWHAPLENALDVVTRDGAVYVTQNRRAARGTATISRLDQAIGSVEWSADVVYYAFDGVSAPAVAGDTVYVHRFGHSGSSGSTTVDHFPSLIGLNADTGATRFVRTHSGQFSSGSRPTVADGAVYAAGGYYGGLDAYAADGTTRWSAPANQQYGWIPAADANHVYVYLGERSFSPGPTIGTLYIYDQATGARSQISHQRSTGGRAGDDGSVMLDGLGNAYALSEVSDFFDRDTLVSFDIDGRSINWEADGFYTGNPSFADGIIALPAGESAVFLDAATGGQLWDWDAPARVSGNIVLTDGLAFVNTADGVHALDLLTHESVWNTPVSGTLAADDGVLYVTNADGIYAFTAVPEPGAGGLVAAISFLLAAGRRRNAPARA